MDLERIETRIERTTSWATVARVMRAATEAGYRRVVFRFAGTSRAPPPPKSSLHDFFVEIGSPPTPSEKVELIPIGQPSPSEAIWRSCPESEKALRSASGLRHTDKVRQLSTELPRAIESCGCDIEIAAVQEWFWNVHGRLWGPPTAAVPVTLAASESDAEHVLRFESSVPWERAHATVVDVAGKGGGIWFAD